MTSAIRHLVLLSLLTAGFSVFASAKKETKRLDKAAAILSGNKVYDLSVEKSVKSDIMGTETSSSGEIFVGGGKFRWETFRPEKSTLVFDGKTVWTMQPSDSGPAQITKTNLGKNNHEQILVKLLAHGKISENFKIKSTDRKDGNTIMVLDAIKPDSSVKDLTVVLGDKPERLKEIRYADDVNNQTKISILKAELVKKPDPKLFKLEVPKGAQVNSL